MPDPEDQYISIHREVGDAESLQYPADNYDTDLN